MTRSIFEAICRDAYQELLEVKAEVDKDEPETNLTTFEDNLLRRLALHLGDENLPEHLKRAYNEVRI
jgi:hypothetical protein